MADDYLDDRMEAINALTSTVGGILKERFHAQQLENFQQQELAQFMQASATFGQAVGTIEDPDQLGQAMSDFHYNTLMPFVTSTSIKYQGNPRILEVANQVTKMHMQGIDEFANFQQKGAEYLQTKATTEREKATAERQLAGAEADRATIPLRQAQARETESGVLLNQARAEEARAKAAAAGQANMLDKFVIPPGASPVEARMFARQADPDVAEKVDSRTIEQQALRLVQNRKGMPRPDGRIWGEQLTKQEGPGAGPTDIDMAADIIKQSPDYDKLIEAGRIAAWQGPEALFQHQGYYDSVIPAIQGTGSIPLPEEISGKLTGNQDTSTILSVLMATPKSTLQDFSTESMEDFIKEDLPKMEDPRQLGPIFQSLFDTAVQKDEFGKVKSAMGREVKDYKDLQDELLDMYASRVMNTMVGRDVRSRPTREQMAKLGAAAVQRFTPIVAKRVGIKIPERAPQQRGQIDELVLYLKRELGLLDKKGEEGEKDGGTVDIGGKPMPSLTARPKPKRSLVDVSKPDSGMVDISR